MAERALGLAHRELGSFDEALDHLGRAVRIALRGEDHHAAALARLSRGYVLANRGQNASALRAVTAALPHLHGAEAGHGRMQRGVVLFFSGRYPEAAREYDAAIALAEEHDDGLGEARARNNRGLLRATVGDPAAAGDDFARAVDLFVALGLDLAGVDVRWNQGIAASQSGDIPGALRLLAAADEEYRRLDVHRPALLIDRLELLLSIPLVDEAMELAGGATSELRTRGMASDLAEALLAQARACLLAGDLTLAASAAADAGAGFRRQGRRSWAAFARHVELRVAFLSGERSPELLAAMRKVAHRLDAAGWTTAALAARTEAAQVAIDLGRTSAARELLEVAARARRRHTGVRCAQGWYAEALLREVNSDRRGMLSALRAGLGTLDSYRAAIGAYDLRAHSGALGEALARTGLRLALESGRASSVLAWAERGRAGALRMTPARPPTDQRLADALAELRVVVTELREAIQTGSPTAIALERRRDQLELRIRDLTRLVEGPTAVARPVAVNDLAGPLGRAVMAEFVEQDGRLYAVVVRDGRAATLDLGPGGPVWRELRILRFALHRLATLPEEQLRRSGALDAARRTAAQLDGHLLGPLRRHLGDRPLVLIPTGVLHAMPWTILPSCQGRPITVAPSATAWVTATSRRRQSGRHEVYVAGPGLAEAPAEVRALARASGSAVALDGPTATAAATIAALDGSRIAHIAAHGQFRRDNPLFSAIELEDGPLTVHDLQTLERPPDLLILSACDLGLATVRPGDELMGLTGALIAIGTRTLVASVLSVPSQDTLTLMTAFHEGLRGGDTVPVALASAHQSRLRTGGARAYAAAASFICFGAA